MCLIFQVQMDSSCVNEKKCRNSSYRPQIMQEVPLLISVNAQISKIMDMKCVFQSVFNQTQQKHVCVMS